MKHIYENFTEIAGHFTRGESWTHNTSDHTPESCIPWQHGVKEFAAWLDQCGLQIVQSPDIHDRLWEGFSRHKPSVYAPCPKSSESED